MRAIETERVTTGGKISLTAYSITSLSSLRISVSDVKNNFCSASIVDC